MFSHRCSRRISGSDRELPSPPKPEGLMIGATGPGPAPFGWKPGCGCFPGISAQIGEVNWEGKQKTSEPVKSESVFSNDVGSDDLVISQYSLLASVRLRPGKGPFAAADHVVERVRHLYLRIVNRVASEECLRSAKSGNPRGHPRGYRCSS